MNIWMINHHASDLGRHEFFAKELIKRGHQVTLFAASFSHNKFEETIQYSRKTFFQINLVEKDFFRIWVKTPAYRGSNYKRVINQLVFSYRAVKIGMRHKKNPPDIIIGSSVHLFAGLAGYCLARKYKVPFIFEVRDLWPQTLVDIGALNEKSPITFVLRKMETFLYKKADKIISVLPKGVDYITLLGINKEKVTYIPNGISLEWFDSNINNSNVPGDIKEFFDSTAIDKQVYCYTGAMGVANGLDTIVDAAKILHDYKGIHFLLVGAGPEREALVSRVINENIINVTFLDSVDKELIPYILINSDVCISIVKKSDIHRYGISMNKIFDYLASGKPMISAMESSIDYIKEANCGISIPPENPAKLAEAVIKMEELLMEDRIKLGKNGRKYVEINHDFIKLTNKLFEVIESVYSNNKMER